MCESVLESKFLDMHTLIEIKNDIVAKYDPFTNANFSLVYCTLGSGEKLSSRVVILLDKAKETLYLAHPSHIIDRSAALVSVFYENNTLKIKKLQKNLERYSEIYELYQLIIQKYQATIFDEGPP